MKIVLAHNFYQIRGGEEGVFEAEAELLEQAGHQVERFTAHNKSIRFWSFPVVAKETLWNPTSFENLSRLLKSFQPDVVHFHNTFPRISPSAYSACREAGVPVVQTLHNYRLLCLNGLFFRDGQPCELCLERKSTWPGVQHRCYRGDFLGSCTVAAMLKHHHAKGTYANLVDRYIVLSEFAREKCIQGGLPAERLTLKPNFVLNAPSQGGDSRAGAVFVGRLSKEKGVDVMLEAWKQIGRRLPLKIIGSGPLSTEVSALASQIPGCEWLGAQPRAEALQAIQSAECLIFPSTCYEGMPLTILEAYACGTPVLASGHGAMKSLVHPGRTGHQFEPANAQSLVRCVEEFMGQPEQNRRMRAECRAEYEAHYTAERNLAQLEEIYRSVLDHSVSSATSPAS